MSFKRSCHLSLLIQYIILHAVSMIGSDRSISSIYHMLKGKTSIQTIQDAKLYKLEYLFGIHKQFHRGSYTQVIESIQEQNLIEEISDNTYIITEAGNVWLQQNKDIQARLYLNGKLFHKQDKIFFFRLQLLVQVWTNKKMSSSNYIPIVEDKEITHWIKQFYKMTYKKTDLYLVQLYEEISTILNNEPSVSADIFVSQLSSYNDIGKTTGQLAFDHQLPEEEVYLLTVNTLHHFLHSAAKNATHFPLLRLLVPASEKKDSITESARLTKRFLNQGMTLTEIAFKRSLKINTIYDHIVELAMIDETFPVDHYISAEEEKSIQTAAARLNTFKLKEIKEATGADISYFQIRLVIARMNHEYERIL